MNSFKILNYIGKTSVDRMVGYIHISLNLKTEKVNYNEKISCFSALFLFNSFLVTDNLLPIADAKTTKPLFRGGNDLERFQRKTIRYQNASLGTRFLLSA